MIVFVLSGLWHGTSLNFVIWGGIHGVLYIAGRLTVNIRNRVWQSMLQSKFQQLRRGIQAVFVFLLVSLTWVFFAVPGLESSMAVLRRIFSWDFFSSFGTIGTILVRSDYMIYISFSILFFIIDSLGIIDVVVKTMPVSRTEIARELVVINSLVVIMLLIGDIGSRSFIYLQF